MPVIGGLQSATFEIGKYLSENNWNVSVITNRYPRALKSCETISGIKVNRYTFLANPFHYLRSGRIDLFFAWLFYKPMTLIRLIIHFNRIKPTIVNLHFPDHQIIECYLLLLIFRFKLIISLHGNEVERMGILKKKTLRYYFYEKLFYSAEYITGCSQYLLNEFQEIFPQNKSEKCFTVHNGVGELYLTQNIKENKYNHIFTATRFVPKKGLKLLFKAFQQDTDSALLIAGGNENELERLELEIKNGISLLGELTPAGVAKQLAASKITIIPSIIEPYGIIVAEAICCGSPIVATNVGGIPEVIALAKKNLNSIEQGVFDDWVMLVEPNVESIRNGIDAVLNNNGSIKDYMSLVPKFREQFFWEKRLEKYRSMLNSY